MEQAPKDPERLLKLSEVEKILRVTRKTVLKYINEGSGSGKLRAQKVNAYWRVRQADLDDFCARQAKSND